MSPYLLNISSFNSFFLPDYGKDEAIIDEYKYDIEPRDSIPDLPSFHESIFGDDYHSEYEDGTLESLDLNVTQTPLGYEFENDDAAWVMACTFMIFTMQTGTYGEYIQNSPTHVTYRVGALMVLPKKFVFSVVHNL